MKRTLLELMVCIVSSATAKAGVTADQLYSECNSSDDSSTFLCEAFLAGVAGVMNDIGHVYDQAEDKNYGPQFMFGLCGNPTGDELRHVFLAWIDRYPILRDRAAAEEATKAFADRWRCP